MVDTGRRVGPSPAKHPITGELKTLEEQRRALDPIVIARKEGWEVGRLLGLDKFTKGSRHIVDVEFYPFGSYRSFVGACIFSDAYQDDDPRACLVESTPAQVRAALKGTLCSCAREDEKCRKAHQSSCPLSEVA